MPTSPLLPSAQPIGLFGFLVYAHAHGASVGLECCSWSVLGYCNKDNQPAEDSSEEMTYPSAEEPLAEPTTEQPITDEQPFAPSPESQLPTEAQGEVNGGPLGCCLGTIAGLFLTVLLIVSASLLLANGANISLATAPVALVGAVLGGYFGWKVGKKLYKEYGPPVLKERRPKPRRV